MQINVMIKFVCIRKISYLYNFSDIYDNRINNRISSIISVIGRGRIHRIHS